MNAIDIVRTALRMSDEGFAQVVADMRDAPLTRANPGGNHPLWILGHLAFIEGTIPHMLFGEPNPVEHWAPMFAPGSAPKDDSEAYPPFDELLSTLRRLRAENLRRLEEVGEAGLEARPKNIPPGFEDVMQTVAQTYVLTALHQMVHYGQVTDARRAARRKPLM